MLKETTSPFWLPPILRGCVGMGAYRLRDEVLDALKRDDTHALVYGEQP